MIMLDGLPSMPCRNTPLQQRNLIKNIMAHMWAISTVGYSDPWPICGPLAEDGLRNEIRHYTITFLFFGCLDQLSVIIKKT